MIKPANILNVKFILQWMKCPVNIFKYTVYICIFSRLDIISTHHDSNRIFLNFLEAHTEKGHCIKKKKGERDIFNDCKLKSITDHLTRKKTTKAVQVKAIRSLTKAQAQL